MADTFSEKFTRCAKVCGLLFLDADWLDMVITCCTSFFCSSTVFSCSSCFLSCSASLLPLSIVFRAAAICLCSCRSASRRFLTKQINLQQQQQQQQQKSIASKLVGSYFGFYKLSHLLPPTPTQRKKERKKADNHKCLDS